MKANERVKYLRKNILKLTQQDFSEALKISRSNMGNIEIGRIALTDRVIDTICEKFNVSDEWLKTGIGEMFLKVPEEDETAALVYELLGPEKNELYDMILVAIKSYKELSPNSQQVIREYAGRIKDNLKKENED